MDILFNIIGTVGVVCVLMAYFLLQVEKLKSDSLKYLLLNFFGALLLVISLIWAWNLPAFIVEACWVLISLFGIIKVLRRQKT